MRFVASTNSFAIVLVALGACSAPEVRVSGTKWNCSNSACHVSFSLTNAGDAPIDANFAIRAQRRVRIRGTEAWRLELVGELNDVVHLERAETRTIERDVEITRRPSAVLVTGWTSR